MLYRDEKFECWTRMDLTYKENYALGLRYVNVAKYGRKESVLYSEWFSLLQLVGDGQLVFAIPKG